MRSKSFDFFFETVGRESSEIQSQGIKESRTKDQNQEGEGYLSVPYHSKPKQLQLRQRRLVKADWSIVIEPLQDSESRVQVTSHKSSLGLESSLGPGHAARHDLCLCQQRKGQGRVPLWPLVSRCCKQHLGHLRWPWHWNSIDNQLQDSWDSTPPTNTDIRTCGHATGLWAQD